MDTAIFQYPFAAPTVPIADPIDGLLKTADLNQPVSVQIVLWDAARAGFLVQLKLNGALVGDIRTLTETEKPGQVITLELSEEFLARDGFYKLAFQATNHLSLLTNDSASIPLKVDKAPPGAALMAPILVPQVTLGDNLTCQIAGYAGMQAGDIIQTLCNGTNGPSHTVLDEEFLSRPTSITFDRDFLVSLGSESVLIEYFVTDRAGNVSTMSLPMLLTLQI